MSLGVASRQGSLVDDIEAFCDRTLPARSISSLLHRERDRLFPDELFADLFSDRGRRSVPPSVVATVMVRQRLEGLSDREAVERYAFDARWRYAAGVGGYDGGGWTSFAHTVLVDLRPARGLRQSPADLRSDAGRGNRGGARRCEEGVGLDTALRRGDSAGHDNYSQPTSTVQSVPLRSRRNAAPGGGRRRNGRVQPDAPDT